MLNVAELNRVLDHCAAHPEQHNQACYFGYQDCATVWTDSNEGAPVLADDWRQHIVACIAGWATILNGWRPIDPDSLRVTNDAGEIANVMIVAKRILNLTNTQVPALFTRTSTISDIRACVARFLTEKTVTGDPKL